MTTTLQDIQNLPKRRYRTVNDLSNALIAVCGLPHQYQKRIDKAERMIHQCNPIVIGYRSLAIDYHRKLHSGLYRDCEQPECVQSRALTSAWGVDRKAFQSKHKSRAQSQRERRNRERVQGDGVHSAQRDRTGEEVP